MSTDARPADGTGAGVETTEVDRAAAIDLERRLPAATAMGAPTLLVGDLERMGEYYATAFGLEPIAETEVDRRVNRTLGRGGEPMMRLIAEPDLPVGGPREAGLFHTAFVFGSPAGLATTVYRAAQHPSTRFAGSADHAVSEAFYFTDPEGNGVELYTDRPRSTWAYDRGEIVVTTDPLDPNAYLREHAVDERMLGSDDRVGTVGHVHLRVGQLAPAREFYVDVLGFDVTQSGAPGALFVSAGGYHHHLAVNTWQSAGAGRRAAALGLGDLAIRLPDRTALDALAERARRHGIPIADDGRAIRLDDPWGTPVTVAVADGA